MCDYPTKKSKASENDEIRMFFGMAVIWPILNLTLQKSNDNGFLILNNHFENRKTNSIGRNVEIEQK